MNPYVGTYMHSCCFCQDVEASNSEQGHGDCSKASYFGVAEIMLNLGLDGLDISGVADN